MIKKTFLLLFTGFSMMAFAQEAPESEGGSRRKEKAEKAEKPEKEPKASKPEKAPKPEKEVQEQTSEFKPEAGDISVDFTANNLFKFMDWGQNQFGMSDEAQGFGGGIRLRYFTSPGFAARVNFVTEMSSYSGFPLATDPLDGLDKMDAAKGSHEQTMHHYSVSLGGEKHFDGTERLDTYAGAELMFSYTDQEEYFRNINSNGVYVEGYEALSSGGFYGTGMIDISDKSAVKNAAGYGLGLRAFVGADFYVFPKIYLGAELGVACSQKWISDYSLKEVDPAASVNRQMTVTNRGNLMNISQDINGQFRIGFRL